MVGRFILPPSVEQATIPSPFPILSAAGFTTKWSRTLCFLRSVFQDAIGVERSDFGLFRDEADLVSDEKMWAHVKHILARSSRLRDCCIVVDNADNVETLSLGKLRDMTGSNNIQLNLVGKTITFGCG